MVALVACEFPKPADIAGEAGPPPRTLTVTTTGPGTVTSVPAGISCAGSTCTTAFDDGVTVALTATPNANAIFTGYGGACAGPQAGCDLVMNADRTVTATFEPFQCTPSTTTCEQQQLIVCDAVGHATITACPLGCHPSLTRCYDLTPSNVGITACLDASASEPDVAIPDGAIINTDDGTITTAAGTPINVASDLIAAPTDGVAVRCFKMKSASIGNVVAVGTPALAIAATGSVTLTGELSATAHGPTGAAPGSIRTSITGEGGIQTGNLSTLSGGGGGGFGGPGADGGSGGIYTGGRGGLANGRPDLVPLRGGCRGGSGGTATVFYWGGGAIQISTRADIHIRGGGGISANGGHGAYLPGTSQNYIPWGGGSGGGILLEAGSVVVDDGGFIAANGGGGGGAAAGQDGQNSTSPATGGPGAPTGTVAKGRGGDGAALTAAATNGESINGWGGGGGGGVGRIRINTVTAFTPAATAVISPAATTALPSRR